MKREAEPVLSPRERIIVAAADLFQRQGIRGVGVEAIAEAAGTNKMTLYRHFGSKDDLIVACLRSVAAEADAIWAEVEKKYLNDPMAQLHAWVRIGAECVLGDARGCDMANTAVELAETNHPARHVIEEFKKDQRDRLARLCAVAGITDAELLADSLYLLVEGARVSCQSVGTEGPGARFIAIAEATIAAFSRRNMREQPARKYAAARTRPIKKTAKMLSDGPLSSR
jgi:AcrR family transcriptional regulator